MVIEFDDAKDAANQQKHGVSLELMARFDLARMITGSARTVKGEPREWAMDTVDGAVWFAVFVRRADAFRVISLRRAHHTERRVYAEKTAPR